jgi:transcriptional antiterminator RfaH
LTGRWYVLCSKLSKEEVLLRQLQSQGYDIFYPRYFTANGATGRLQIKAYFPGYLFIRLDLNSVNQTAFQWMPNSEGLVSFESRPAYVPDNLIEAIKRHVDKLNSMRLVDLVKNSDTGDGTAQRIGAEDSLNTIFDAKLTSDERISGLMRMLRW